MFFISKQEATPREEGEINSSFYYILESSELATEGAVELVGDYLTVLCQFDDSNGVTDLDSFY